MDNFSLRKMYEFYYINFVISFQGDLVYAITGTYPAQDFFSINERDGRITVLKNLKEDVARADKYIVS